MSRTVREIGLHRVVEWRPSGLREESKAFILFAWEQEVRRPSGRLRDITEQDVVGVKVGNWFFWSGESSMIA
mgnify:FL=1